MGMKELDISIHCQTCSFSHLCLPVSLNDNELESLDDIIKRENPLQKNTILFSEDTPFTSLYAVRTGSFKTVVSTEDGQEQVVGFHFPGDLLGFDSLNSNHHQSTAIALETSMVCELPYHTLDQLAERFPKLRKQIMNSMSSEFKQKHELMMLLNKRKAEERLLYFLTQLSQRFGERGFSNKQFHLTMTRNDIGNYLGVTIETISRLLTRFQKEKLIKVDGKLIVVLEYDVMLAKSKGLHDELLQQLAS